ncbi:MAG TPA: glucosaminidase domain-containing protein [Acidimicrobiia bacterium]
MGTRSRRLVVPLVLAVGALSLVGPPSVAEATTPVVQTPVMGPATLNATQLGNWYLARHGANPNVPTVNNNIYTLARIFLDEGKADGVRGDIAFAQSMLETGWLAFPSYGQIRNNFNNFAGLFAFDGRANGTTCAAEGSPSRCFPTAWIGVQTQIQLLRGYADPSVASTTNRLIKPPSYDIGVAPDWEQFGGQSGRAIWASASGYGVDVVKLYDDALAYNSINPACIVYLNVGTGRTTGNGYWLFGADGSTYPIGTAPNYGNLTKLRLNAPIVTAQPTPDHHGYWMLGSDGGVFSFGDAAFHGSTGNMTLTAPVNSFATTTDGGGYWLAAGDGGVFTFGDAHFYGSAGATPKPAPVVGIETDATGKGYWLVRSDGGVYAYGDAPLYGSAYPNHNIVEIKKSADAKGYYILRSDGAVDSHGDARRYGDLRSCGMSGGASHMIVTPTGNGYWIVTKSGEVLAFGDARPLGMPGATSASVAGAAFYG